MSMTQWCLDHCQKVIYSSNKNQCCLEGTQQQDLHSTAALLYPYPKNPTVRCFLHTPCRGFGSRKQVPLVSAVRSCQSLAHFYTSLGQQLAESCLERFPLLCLSQG
jgi:hypothetical protein